MATFARFVYILLLALWVGGISLFTFVVTPQIFSAYGRDAAGEIVGRLFPNYFLFTLALSVLVLLILPFCRTFFSQSSFRWSLALVSVAVAINVFVFFKLHPEMRQVKQEVRSFQSLEDSSPARKTFRRLHAASMTLNLVLLADGAALLLISSAVRR